MNPIDESSLPLAKKPSTAIFVALLISALVAVGTLVAHRHNDQDDPSYIRIINGSNVDFFGVVVGGKEYGDIMRGKATEYIQWEVAYAYASLRLKTHNKSYEQVVDDFYGEKPLGIGHFSYTLTFDDNGNLQIEARKDRD